MNNANINLKKNRRPLWRVISGVDRDLVITETINDGNRDLFESVAFHWWKTVTISSAVSLHRIPKKIICVSSEELPRERCTAVPGDHEEINPILCGRGYKHRAGANCLCKTTLRERERKIYAFRILEQIPA